MHRDSEIYVLVAEYSDQSGHEIIAAYANAVRGQEDVHLLREHGDRGMNYELKSVKLVTAESTAAGEPTDDAV